MRVTPFLLILSSALVMAADPPTWSQWRGPTRDCVTTGPAFPDNLTSLNQTWRVELGPSYSGPIVLADRVIVTESPDEKTEDREYEGK